VPRLTTDFDDAYRAAMAPYWPDRTLLDHLDEQLATRPEDPAVIGHVHATGARHPMSRSELGDRVDRIAAGLLDLGVQRGQVVSIQLPNWWQMVALHLACLRVGAVTNALMPVFRARELEFMLGLAESVVFVCPEEFNGFDYASMAGELRPLLPALEHVITVRSDGADDFEKLLLARPATEADRAEFARRALTPDDVAQLAYTSGTTGEPKGVMLTSNTVLCNVRDYADRLRLTGDDVVLMSSPLAHQTGFLYGLAMTVARGMTLVLQDVWKPDRATEIIRDEGVTFTMGATPFLVDLCACAEADPAAFTTLRVFVCGGAPVPRDLVRKAGVAMGAQINSCWGMSEIAAITLTGPDDPQDRVFSTDGSPLPGCELRILASDGSVAPVGEEGRLVVKACSLFGGYLKRPDLRGLDAAGWFDTGDLARLDADGYLRITGRSKDLIIRGGENIPVVEIENLLFGHPDIAEVAVVGQPDPRLGERICAFVVPRPGTSPQLDDIATYLLGRGTAKIYLPERLELVDALPRTPTGKVQKFRLREMLRGDAGVMAQE
jgi:cyclohexanecarboxylate-CoA ligase